MKSKFKSNIEVDKNTGHRCLIVYYHFREDNFNEAIAAAHKQHGIKHGQMTTIAMPQ